MNKIQILILLILFAFSNVLQAQTKDEIEAQRLIAASQTGGAPVFFKVEPKGVKLVDTGKTNYPTEFIIRGGLPNFFYKARKGTSLRLGFIGGSITKGDGMYRNQSANYIQSMFPKAKMMGLNAGVSGTGSDLGACRLSEQILKYNPDIVFIEFAVNGAYPQGVEGIIRQIRQFNAHIDICLLYTMGVGQGAIYASGGVPKQIQGLEKLAEHYGIPSIHMGLSIGILEKDGAVVWKGDPSVETTKIVFSKDGTHPLPAGGNLYAAAVARSFEKMKILDNEFPPKQNSFDELQIQYFIEEAILHGEIRIRGSKIKYFRELKMLLLIALDGKYCFTTEPIIVELIHCGVSKIGNLKLNFKTISELIDVVKGFENLLVDSSQLDENDRKVLEDIVALRASQLEFRAMLYSENNPRIARLI
ncbi:MAG: SGNH/GDSL hydrolase family protein [Flavobacterium sp.]|nr:MAG: SGNH/GDSL hydrolase family protein [Flavobacterium sp.]